MVAGSNEPLWLLAARKDLDAGVKETPGSGGTKRIIEMYDHAGLAHSGDDDQSWCGCAVGTWLIDAGYPTPPNFYGAKQFERYGVPVTPSAWRPGDIAVFYRTKLREKDWRRHVGLVLGETKTHYEILGGNQRVKGSKMDGVTITTIAKKDLSALRRPVAPTPKALAAAGSVEMQTASDMKKVGLATIGTGAGGAAVSEAIKIPAAVIPDIEPTQVTEQIGVWQSLVESAGSMGKLLGAYPWMAATVVMAIAIYILAKRIERRRIERARQGDVMAFEPVEAG